MRIFNSNILFLFVLLVMISCGREEKRQITSKDGLYLYLDTLEKRYEATYTNIQLARRDIHAGGASYNLDSVQSELAKIFLDTSIQNIIEEWLGRSNSLADKLLTRRLELWHRAFIGGSINFDPEIFSLQNSIHKRLEDFKFTIGRNKLTGSDLGAKLKYENKQKRRKVIWAAYSQTPDDIRRDFIRLIKIRNEHARAFGFSNYYSLILNLQAIDEDWLLTTFKSLSELTQNDFNKLILTLKKKLRIKAFEPWDLEFAQKEENILSDKYFSADFVFDVLHRFESGIGFQLDSLQINDIRILLSPQKGMHFYSAAFFQYGRALRAAHTKVDYPILKGYDQITGTFNPSFDDGVAMMHNEFLSDSVWLGSFTKAKDREVKKYLSQRSMYALLRLRRMLKDFAVEYEIYNNPDRSLDSINHAMFDKYLFGKTNKSEAAHFIYSSSYITSPCSFHNSILREMIVAQFHEALTSKFGNDKISNPKIAAWMIEYIYSPGETIEWWERLRNATGKSLEPGAYLRKLGIEHAGIITVNE